MGGSTTAYFEGAVRKQVVKEIKEISIDQPSKTATVTYVLGYEAVEPFHSSVCTGSESKECDLTSTKTVKANLKKEEKGWQLLGTNAAASKPSSGAKTAVAGQNADLDTLKKTFNDSDKEINQVYKDVMGKLSPGAKAELKRTQIAWIKEKEKTCNSESDEGKRLECLIRMTNERTEELKKSLTD